MVNDDSRAAGISGSSPKMTAKLARKRARDRRAQQAMRDRTKTQLDALRIQVAQLSQQLDAREAEPTTTTSPGIPSPRHIDEHGQLRRENERLRHQLAQARQITMTSTAATAAAAKAAATAPSPPFSHGVTLDPSILEYWSSCVSWPVASPSVFPPTHDHTVLSYTAPLLLSERPDAPWHVPPTCPADHIMQPFFEEKRRLVQSFHVDSASPISSASSSAWHGAIQSSISKVAADVLATYSEIDTLPKKVACLYIISNVLNVANPP